MNPRFVSLLTILVAWTSALVATPAARAATTLTDDAEVIVQSHEVIEDDLIVWSGYVRVDGLVKGDLVAFGEEVVIEGIVEGDVIAVGKTVYLNGQVSDDARIAGYAVALGEQARVADDVFELSYSFEGREGSRVGGALFSASRQVLLAGQVVEDAFVRAGALALRGLVGGSVRAVVGGLEGVAHSQFVIDLALEIQEIPDGITVASAALIGGELDHRSLGPAVVESGAKITGGVRHEAWQVSPTGAIGMPTADDESFFGGESGPSLERFAVVLLVGVLLAVAAPRWLSRRGTDVRDDPMTMLGWGVGAVLFWGLASFVIAIVSVVGLTLALSVGAGGLAWTAIAAGSLLQLALFGGVGLTTFYLGPVLASAGVGGEILARLQRSDETSSPAIGKAIGIVAIGAVVYTGLHAIPWLGFWIGLAATLVGLGAFAIWLRDVFTGLDDSSASPEAGTGAKDAEE